MRLILHHRHVSIITIKNEGRGNSFFYVQVGTLLEITKINNLLMDTDVYRLLLSIHLQRVQPIPNDRQVSH